MRSLIVAIISFGSQVTTLKVHERLTRLNGDSVGLLIFAGSVNVNKSAWTSKMPL